MLRILVPEKRQSARSERFFQRRDVRLDLRVQPDLVVHLLLDVAQFFRIHMRKVRKVKPQPLRRIQRTGLLHMRPQNIPQRRIHKVRPRVVPDNPRPPLRICHHRHAIPDAKRLFRHNLVRHQPRNRIKRASHIRQQLRFRVIVERPGIRHLPARLRINCRPVQNDFAALPGNQFVDCPELRDNRFNPAILRRRPKIKIRLRLKRLRQLRIRRIRRLLRPALPRRPRPRPLLLQGRIEAGLIELHAHIARCINHEIQRQAVSVV